MTNLFNNVFWPVGVTYSVNGDAGGKCKGSAHIEHCQIDNSILSQQEACNLPALMLTSDNFLKSAERSCSATILSNAM